MLGPRHKIWALAIAVVAAGCQPDRAEQAPREAVNEVSPKPALRLGEPPMDRAALLMAAAKAASATALGQDDTEEQRRLDGMRFEGRIRFGCATGARPQSRGGPFRIVFDEKDRALRIRAAPDLTLSEPLVAAIAGETAEAVEGFWMRRPWLLADGCLAAAPQPRPATPEPAEAAANTNRPVTAATGQRIGVAQFFSEADSRTARRDSRAYEATKVLAEGERPSLQGYNLVLSGRLRQLPSGRVISCRLGSADAPPDCVISAEFDRVRIEDPATKRIIAEWSG